MQNGIASSTRVHQEAPPSRRVEPKWRERSGRLRRILPQWHGPSTTVYAVTETRLLPAKTQRFIEFLRERLSRA
jgi:DNA-binding transcriptional LysR family regulator